MPLTNPDPLAMLDARIRRAWSRRSSCTRFSEAYWEADDDLAWLRMVRDELARTGHLRNELRAMIDALPVALERAIDIEDGRPAHPELDFEPLDGERADQDPSPKPVAAGVP